MIARSLRLLCLLAVCACGLAAQAANPAPADAKSIVVRIRSTWNRLHLPEDGAGVIVGVDANNVWVATARHVVAYFTQDETYKPADSVWVSFYRDGTGSDSVRAEVVLIDSTFLAADYAHLARARAAGVATAIAEAERVLALHSATLTPDLAALRIPRRGAQLPAVWASSASDRLGDPRKLKPGELVFPMGCPRDECWLVPVSGEGLVSVQPSQLLFQSTFVAPGSSGGALFNDRWEVVGIVTASQPPLALAMSMRYAVALLDSARIPVGLRAPQLPRSGYHTTFEATMLTALNAPGVPDSLAVTGTQPSGRITFTTRGRTAVTWRVSALRLAPYNTTVTAALGGVGLTLRWGRISAQPFAELGMGRVESRYDRGGYHVASNAGAASYVPLWTLERQDGLGVGGGLAMEFVIVPHVSVAATVARWNFGLTPNAPPFPSFFAGGGLRWSR